MSNKTIQINELTKAQYPSHGGNKTTVAEKNGINPNDLIDFSASINPFGPPACLAQLLMETPRLLREYPDTECSAIKQKLSKTLEIPEDWLFMANGSTELIHLLPNLLEIKLGVAIIAPCFSEYEKAFSINDIPNHYISLPHEQDFHAEPSKLIPQLNLLDQLGAVVIGNPSTPAGKLYGEFILQIYEYCKKRDILLVVDEAFIDFAPPYQSAWNFLSEKNNLILIRSLTKFYSIPGLRIGYGIMAPEKVKRIFLHQYPWSVNSLAQVIGAEVISDLSFKDKTNKWLHTEQEFIFGSLNSIREIETFSSKANFFLFRIKDKNKPKDFYQHLLSQSLLVRNCGNFHGLDESFFRVSLREHEDNQKLIHSIKEYFLSTKPG